MNNPLKFWVIVVVLGVCTYVIRASFIVLMNGRRLNGVWPHVLRFIPASILATLSIPALIFARSGSNEWADPERMIAGILAIVVACYSRNILLTISSGMAMLWFLRWVF